MLYFMTEYEVERREWPFHLAPTDLFGSEILARNIWHARWLAWRRGLGERVISSGYVDGPQSDPPSVVMAKFADGEATAGEALHALSWLCHVARTSGVARAGDITGDHGLIHEFAHYLHISPDDYGKPALSHLMRMTEDMEQLVPGFPLPRKAA